MALLKFLKGNYSSLNNASIAEGQILITKDTREIFVDVDASTRIKIGDFITVANMDALPAASSVPTTRLYYVEDGNILARSNGTEWVQVNKQKTAAELKEMLGIGTLETKEDATAKLNAAKKYTDDEAKKVQDEVDALEKYVGTIPETAEAKDIVAYVQEKTAGIATDAALSELTGRVATAEGEIDALQAANAEGGAVHTAIANAQQAADDAAAAAATADGKAVAAQNAVDALAGKVGTVEEGKNLADLVADAQEAADEAQRTADSKATMAEVEAKGYQNAEQVQAIADGKDEAIAAALKAGTDAQADVDALELKVGEVAEGKTIVKMIEEAQEAATYDDTALAGRVTTVEGKVAAIEEDYLTSADKEALQTQINTIMSNPDAEGAINSINEFTQYVKDHGTIAEGFRTDIDNNAKSIAANSKAISDHATEAASTYETKTDAASKLTEAKEHATNLNTAMDNRVKVLEAIEHDAYIAADEAVLSDAKDYVDQKNDAMNERVEALEAIDHSHANKDELDLIASGDKAKWDAAAAKAHEHANAAELAKIADGDVAKWNAAEQNAKDYADTKNEAIAAALKAGTDAQADIDAFEESYATEKAALDKAISDNATAIGTKANAADVYAKTETYTQEEVDAAIEAAVNAANAWGEF